MRPDQNQLRRVSRLALTYPEQGATAWPQCPPGYRTVQRTQSLGRGAAVYDRACAGLLSWQMHRHTGLAVTADAPAATAGSCVILTFGWRPIGISAPCRVVYDVNEARTRGFAYGTLPGHPESGEEAFIVTHESDDTVSFTVRAFSRPATFLARAGGPLTHRVQALMTNRYLKSLSAIANH